MLIHSTCLTRATTLLTSIQMLKLLAFAMIKLTQGWWIEHQQRIYPEVSRQQHLAEALVKPTWWDRLKKINEEQNKIKLKLMLTDQCLRLTKGCRLPIMRLRKSDCLTSLLSGTSLLATMQRLTNSAQAINICPNNNNNWYSIQV